MNNTKHKILTVGFVIFALLSACQKEKIGHLELVAEGMNRNNKMTVDGLSSYWQSGDKVSINGVESTITISGNRAYVEGEFSADNYTIVFPSSILQSRNGNTITVDMPDTYQYKSVFLSGVGNRQVLDAPLVYYGTADDGRAMMLHLTGTLNIQISGPSGILIDRITVSTTQNHVMSGSMQFDLSDFNSIGSSETNNITNNKVQMLFYGNNFSTGSVKIPIPVLNGNVNFTVKVEGHMNNTGLKHTFVRTQTTGGHLGRGVVGNVAVNMNAGAEGVTTSALFESTTLNETTYYLINNSFDFRLFSLACKGYTYREDGENYHDDWVYNGLKYNDANYLLTSDIDMNNISMEAINKFKGKFNGMNHTIHNLDIVANNDYEWGLFINNTIYNRVQLLENITFNGLRITGRTADEYRISGGALSGGGYIDKVSNVHINNFTVGRSSDNYCLALGGFFGMVGTNCIVENSSVSFSPNQTITGSNYYVRYLTPTVLGGIVGSCSANSLALTVSNTIVNFNNLVFQSTYNQTKCFFGGVFNSEVSNPSVGDIFSNVTITGNVTIGGSNIYTAKIYTTGGSNYTNTFVNEIEGVDVSGLTINGN